MFLSRRSLCSLCSFSHQIKCIFSYSFERTMASAARSRDDPVIMTLDTPEFRALFTPEVVKLRDLFQKYDHELRLAGGPVRDLLSGIRPKDLDFATTATPTQMKEMFQREGVRLINANGEKHGTITPRIDDKENFEITTLRIDVVTDGRRAEVKFTNDWKLDAGRRDLTVNSMFLGFDGRVYDYFYGHDDLKVKRIAFVGDADTRIREDYLRIMRYFRFYGRLSDSADNHEAETLVSIKENAKGLEIVSGERIWMELKKILMGKFSGELLKTMLHLGLAKYLGLPERPNLSELDKIYGGKYGKTLHPIALIASLLENINDVIALNNRLKFSVYDRDLAYFIVENRNLIAPEDAEKPLLKYQMMLLHSKIKPATMREYIVELLKYLGNEDLKNQFESWQMPKFYHIPIPMLNEYGATVPKHYALIINELKTIWARHNFDLGIEEIKKLIPDIAAKYEQRGDVRTKKNVKN